MSIKWYRDSGQRVLTPRRDKPRGPKSIKPKKTKKIGVPRSPGVRKPRVKIPFVTARNKRTFYANYSASGLSAIQLIMKNLGLVGGDVSLELNGNSNCAAYMSGKDEFFEATMQEKENICAYYSRKDFTWDGVQQECRARVVKTEGSGIWALTHINCTCSLKVELINKDNPKEVLYYRIYTLPAKAKGPTAQYGYDFLKEYSTITPEEIENRLKKIAIGENDFVGFKEMNSTDAATKALADETYNNFDKGIAPDVEKARKELGISDISEEEIKNKFGVEPGDEDIFEEEPSVPPTPPAPPSGETKAPGQ